MNNSEGKNVSPLGNVEYWGNRSNYKSKKEMINELELDIKNVEHSFSAEILQREIDRLNRK